MFQTTGTHWWTCSMWRVKARREQRKPVQAVKLKN